MFKTTLLAMLGLLIFVTPLLALTNIDEGSIGGTWTIENSPYIINGELEVPADSTLTIQPGVQVTFNGHWGISVKGVVNAVATPADSIYFDVADTTGFADSTSTAGSWRGFVYTSQSTLTDSSKFSHVSFKHAKKTINDPIAAKGGAFYLNGYSNVSISNCLFSYNTAYEQGGAIACLNNSSPVITNNYFSNNWGHQGAAFWCYDFGTPTFTGNQLVHNNTSEAFGAYFTQMQGLEITNNIFMFNGWASNTGGGGLSVTNASGRIYGNTIARNYGRGLYMDSCQIDILNNQFLGNGQDTSLNGGGLELSFCSGLMANNLVANNAAPVDGGGAKLTFNQDMRFYNNTFANNSALQGGAIFANYASTTFNNSIFWGNTATEGPNYFWIANAAPTYNYCTLQDGENGIEAANGMPGSAIINNCLEDNPMFVNADNGNFHLPEESPCVGAGSPSTDWSDFDTDLDGNYRVCGGFIDQGCYETVLTNPATDVTGPYVLGTWHPGGSPYLVHNNIFIDEGDTLSIQPGVEVRFLGHYEITVRGQLFAMGTREDRINFTVPDTTGLADTTTDDGGWVGITFMDVAAPADSSIIDYCNLKYAKQTHPINEGGVIHVDNFSSLRVSNTNITHCHANLGGGGIYLKNSDALIKNCQIAYSRAQNYGCALSCYNSEPIVQNVIMANNKAQRGAALYAMSSQPQLYNCIMVNNQAERGGAVMLSSSDVEFVNCTIANNYASNHGGSVYCLYSNPTFFNSILWGSREDTLDNQVYLFDIDSDPWFIYSCLEYGMSGLTGLGSSTYNSSRYQNNISSNPSFVQPTSNYGLIYNGLVADWTIRDNSPCRNAGDPETNLNGYPTDSNGIPVDFNNQMRLILARIDMGAIENQTTPTSDVNQKPGIALVVAPNPFNPTTTISFNQPQSGQTLVSLYNLKGQKVKTIFRGQLSAGKQNITLNGTDDYGRTLGSGVYFVRLVSGHHRAIQKVMLLK